LCPSSLSFPRGVFTPLSLPSFVFFLRSPPLPLRIHIEVPHPNFRFPVVGLFPSVFDGRISVYFPGMDSWISPLSFCSPIFISAAHPLPFFLFCPNSWLIMQRDFLKQPGEYGIKQCFSLFFLPSFFFPLSENVPPLAFFCPLFFSLLYVVNLFYWSFRLLPRKSRLKMHLKWSSSGPCHPLVVLFLPL